MTQWFRVFVWGISAVVVVIGLNGFYSSIVLYSELSGIIVSLFTVLVGLISLEMGHRDSKWLEEGDNYINTSEGTVVAGLLLWLSLLSFVTVIDRAPSILPESGQSPEGLFVVPHPGLFPVASDISVLVSTFLFSLVLVAVGRVLGRWLQRYECGYILNGIVTFMVTLLVFFVLLYLDLQVTGGIEIKDRTLLSTPPTNWVMFGIMWFLMLLPIPVYGLPLLPDWTKNVWLGETKRDGLEVYIASNWRRARLFTTLVFTGVVGTTLPFVFSQDAPNFLFVVAIIGSVSIGPLGVIWFLMRRIREAEKELRPDPP